MELKVARNIDEFDEIIKSLGIGKWYRGMDNASYSLEPSLFRKKRIIGSERSLESFGYNGILRKSDAVMRNDIDVMDKFIEQYKTYRPKDSSRFNFVDYLYIMQHYGIPTRLLDFSTNQYIALFFAVSSCYSKTYMKNKMSSEEEIKDFYNNDGYSEHGVSVHCIDPNKTNELTNPFNCDSEKLINVQLTKNQLQDLDFPICVKSNNQNKRIKAQSGVFMIFGSIYQPYEVNCALNKHTTKIFLPNSCCKDIKQELERSMKISHSTVYPDMKGIAMEMIEEIDIRYHESCEYIFSKS